MTAFFVRDIGVFVDGLDTARLIFHPLDGDRFARELRSNLEWPLYDTSMSTPSCRSSRIRQCRSGVPHGGACGEGPLPYLQVLFRRMWVVAEENCLTLRGFHTQFGILLAHCNRPRCTVPVLCSVEQSLALQLVSRQSLCHCAT